MAEEPQPESLRDRVGSRGEEVLGRIAQDLLENPWVNSALSGALEARGRAAHAQEVAMELLNIPSAAQIERLTRRVRSVSQRLESIEDALPRLDDGVRAAGGRGSRRSSSSSPMPPRSSPSCATRASDGPAAVSRDQERLRVEDMTPGDSPSA